MKFEKALKLMREGKKLRIPAWKSDVYMTVDHDENQIYVGGVFSDPSLDFDEIMSDNWEIME